LGNYIRIGPTDSIRQAKVLDAKKQKKLGEIHGSGMQLHATANEKF